MDCRWANKGLCDRFTEAAKLFDHLKNGEITVTTSDPQPRIVILLPDFSGGGAERLHILLANHWHAQGIKVDFVDEHLVVMREHEKNDAKSIHSVYRRVKKFHTEALLSTNARSRAGSLVNKRVARDYLSYGLAFIAKLDMHHGREAVFDAIKVYPLCLAKPSFIAAITLLFLPFSVSKYLLTKLGKLSPDSTISCD